MFANLIHSLFGGFKENLTNPSVACQEDNPKTSEEKYKTEIQALTDYFGELKNGVCIEIELSQLLQIIPKDRRRIDAYRGLISYLHEQYGVTLTIKSRKTK
ncbi:hypothetical protein [Culturomica massiliensis]|jgi:hypothetical protein|uniref:hypothetical protein n=1 Tax=Culturomica massiliensis TaxID=1841857 RepID=UPI000E5601AC|nr:MULTISPECIES: hypothetical protein [Odoribacteraceae]RHV89627.1 hypothetical protein DXA95_15875 [Odoribacter sp. OF09-27XD]